MNFIKKTISIVSTVLFTVAIIALLLLSVRGKAGNPNTNDLSLNEWQVDGPFELSPERGRFGLTYSLVEDKSFYFTVDLARFITPDLGYSNNHYVSLFAPAVSFIIMPGYVIGRYLGYSQLGSYLIIVIFALVNMFLVFSIVNRITRNKFAGIISGIVFLFATPAYSYAVSLYQHHISTALILGAIYILISTRKIWPLFFVWLLCAMSIPVDYPNLFLMFPIGVCALLRMVNVLKSDDGIRININMLSGVTFVGLILPILFFGWFNKQSYGDPLQFSGTIGSVRAIDENGMPAVPEGANFEDVEDYLNPDSQDKSSTAFFESRDILNGIYLHITSPDRGIVYFAPIILFGLFGVFLMNKSKNEYLPVFIGIIFADLILYSMWGDPWGGWAFGSRYLIPAYSIMAIFIGVALSQFSRKWLFLILFYPVLVYSILVNTLGALTTSANPPKVEALPLETISGRRERYSHDRNWEFLTSGRSKSFVFQTWGKNYVDSVTYYYIVSGTIIFLTTSLLVLLILKKHENKN